MPRASVGRAVGALIQRDRRAMLTAFKVASHIPMPNTHRQELRAIAVETHSFKQRLSGGFKSKGARLVGFDLSAYAMAYS